MKSDDTELKAIAFNFPDPTNMVLGEPLELPEYEPPEVTTNDFFDAFYAQIAETKKRISDEIDLLADGNEIEKKRIECIALVFSPVITIDNAFKIEEFEPVFNAFDLKKGVPATWKAPTEIESLLSIAYLGCIITTDYFLEGGDLKNAFLLLSSANKYLGMALGHSRQVTLNELKQTEVAIEKGKNANKARVEMYAAIEQDLKRYWKEKITPDAKPSTAARILTGTDIYKQSKTKPSARTIEGYVREWQKLPG